MSLQGSTALHTKVSDVLARQLHVMSFSSSPSSSSEEISWKMLNLLQQRPTDKNATVNRDTLEQPSVAVDNTEVKRSDIEASNLWASLRPSPRIALPSWSCPWLSSCQAPTKLPPAFAPPTSQLQLPARKLCQRGCEESLHSERPNLVAKVFSCLLVASSSFLHELPTVDQ